MIHYLGNLEKSIKMFGYLFSDIHIRRWNEDNSEKQDICVPIEFGGKERMFFLLNNRMKNENIKLENVFPRLGYNVKDILYDSSRMLNKDIKISSSYTDKDEIDYLEVEYNRVPVNVKFELLICAVRKSDLFMILEQIIPWFKPSLTIRANLNPYVGDDNVSIPIVYESALFKDFNNEAPFSNNEDQVQIYTMNFNVKTYLYCLNNEDDNGNYPGSSGLGKAIREIELGSVNYDDSRIVTDNSLYTIKYPIIEN